MLSLGADSSSMIKAHQRKESPARLRHLAGLRFAAGLSQSWIVVAGRRQHGRSLCPTPDSQLKQQKRLNTARYALRRRAASCTAAGRTGILSYPSLIQQRITALTERLFVLATSLSSFSS